MSDDAQDGQAADRSKAVERAKLAVLLYLENASLMEQTEWQSRGFVLKAVAAPVLELHTPKNDLPGSDNTLVKNYTNPFQERDPSVAEEAVAQLLAGPSPFIEEQTGSTRGKISTYKITEAGSRFLKEQTEAQGIELTATRSSSRVAAILQQPHRKPGQPAVGRGSAGRMD